VRKTTQDAFARAVKIIGTTDYKLMKKVRDSITFHYLHDNVESALAMLAEKAPERPAADKHRYTHDRLAL
jgi:uncharacterized protein with HEPN domain